MIPIRRRRSRLLGLELDGDRLRVVEVSLRSGGAALRRAGTLAVPSGAIPGNPDLLGEALARFLAEGRHGARRAVLALAARHLAALPLSIPATDPATLAAALSLRASHELAMDPGGLVLDHAGEPGGTEPVLLVAAARPLVEGLAAAAHRAGLRVEGATASILALASSLPAADGAGEALVLERSSGADLAVVRPGGVDVLLHLADGESWPQALESRADTTAPLPVRLFPRDASGPRDAATPQAAVEGDLSALGIRATPFASGAEALPYAGAAAAALAAHARRGLPLDLLHPRAAPPRAGRFGRRRGLALAVAVLALAAGVDRLRAARQEEDEVAGLEARLEELRPELDEARRLSSMLSRASGWCQGRPHYLECLRGLTLAFPEEGGIWTTSLAAREDMRLVVSGAARDRRGVLEVLDRLRSTPGFQEVQLVDLRGASRDEGEVRYTFGFRYQAPGASGEGGS